MAGITPKKTSKPVTLEELSVMIEGNSGQIFGANFSFEFGGLARKDPRTGHNRISIANGGVEVGFAIGSHSRADVVEAKLILAEGQIGFPGGRIQFKGTKDTLVTFEATRPLTGSTLARANAGVSFGGIQIGDDTSIAMLGANLSLTLLQSNSGGFKITMVDSPETFVFTAYGVSIQGNRV